MLYEYIGFQYYITVDADGLAVAARPKEDQHPAAYKDKHRQNAVEQYNSEFNS